MGFDWTDLGYVTLGIVIGVLARDQIVHDLKFLGRYLWWFVAKLLVKVMGW